MPIKATISASSWARLSDLLNDETVQAQVKQAVEHAARDARRRVLADLRFTREKIDRTRFVWMQESTPRQRRAGRLIATRFLILH